MDELQKKIVDYVEANGKTYQQIALEIHEKPEVSNYEFFASKRLADQIKSVGFEVEMPAAGHRTGFAASYKSGKPGPVMVFLAEYDALVGLGHGCGHNLFGATSSLAAAALKSVIDEVGGEVRLYGTPGEEGGENGSAKGSFVREGYFKDVDAALSAHPGEIFLEKKPPLKLACMKKQLNPENYLDLEYSIREMEQGNSPASIFLGKVGVGLFYESLKAHRFKPYDFVFIILEEDDPIKGQVIHIPESTWAIVRFHGSHEQAPGFYEKLLAYFKDEGFAPESFALEMTLIDYGLTHDQSQFITEIQIPLNPDCPGIIA